MVAEDQEPLTRAFGQVEHQAIVPPSPTPVSLRLMSSVSMVVGRHPRGGVFVWPGLRGMAGGGRPEGQAAWNGWEAGT